VTFIFLAMLTMIVGSIIVELILPQAVKDRLGTLICWGMMSFTMIFLGLATVGLLVATWVRFIQPALAS
jgi:hypothetical protein